MKTDQANLSTQRAFTLIELLVVISIISVIAGMTLVVAGSVGKTRKISVVKGELAAIESALDNYKAKYGVYPPSNQNGVNTYSLTGNDRSQLSQLYYELVGTTNTGISFMVLTLDDNSTISTSPANLVSKAYGVGGFVNCSKHGGGGEDTALAKNFLPSLTSKQIDTYVTNVNGVDRIRTTALITSVGGPDDNYKPLAASGLNPIRYVYPGTNNVGSYDLWVQLQISGKKYLVCNWSKSVQVNSPMP